jgi:hypothetical protein
MDQWFWREYDARRMSRLGEDFGRKRRMSSPHIDCIKMVPELQ